MVSRQRCFTKDRPGLDSTPSAPQVNALFRMPSFPMPTKSCLNTILDDFDADQFGDSFFIWPRVAQLVITFYLLIVTLVLMNMLIAKMGDTYNRISEIAELEWLLQVLPDRAGSCLGMRGA